MLTADAVAAFLVPPAAALEWYLESLAPLPAATTDHRYRHSTPLLHGEVTTAAFLVLDIRAFGGRDAPPSPPIADPRSSQARLRGAS